MSDSDNDGWPDLSQCVRSTKPLMPPPTTPHSLHQPQAPLSLTPSCPTFSSPSSCNSSSSSSVATPFQFAPVNYPPLPYMATNNNNIPQISSYMIPSQSQASQYPPPPAFIARGPHMQQQQQQQVQPYNMQTSAPTTTVAQAPLPKSRGHGRKANGVTAALASQNTTDTIRHLVKQVESLQKEYQTLATKSAEAAFAQHSHIKELEQRLANTEKLLSQSSQTLAKVCIAPVGANSVQNALPLHCNALLDALPILKILCQHVECHLIRFNVCFIIIFFELTKPHIAPIIC